MKNSKIVAAMSAAAMAVSMMAMPASAMTIPVPAGEEFNFTLNTSSDATKLKQIPFEYLPDALSGMYVKQITFTGTIPDDKGWVGGEGAFGMNYGEDWVQIDFGFDKYEDGVLVKDYTNVVEEGNVIQVTIDLPAYAPKGNAQDFDSDGLAQFGWWWGAGDTIDITNVAFVVDTEYPAKGGEDVDPTDGETTEGETTEGETTEGETTDELTTADLNGDGTVNVADLSQVAGYVKGIYPLDPKKLAAADVNKDGSVNVADVVKIAAYITGISTL
jgi:hypothetical protein